MFEERDVEDDIVTGWTASFVMALSLDFPRVHVERCLAVQSLVRAENIVPDDVEGNFLPDSGKGHGENHATGELGFQGADEAFDDGDAAVFADGPEAGFDFVPFAPRLELIAPELTALVGDDVLGRFADGTDQAGQGGFDLLGGRLVWKDGKAHATPGKVIDHEQNPEPERPALGQGEGKPWSPEPGRGGSNGQVNMPDVVGILGGDRAGGRFFLRP